MMKSIAIPALGIGAVPIAASIAIRMMKTWSAIPKWIE
jgi:hypothetical protein